MPRRVAVVTDSSASLPPDLAARFGIVVVQMQLQIGDELFAEEHVPVKQVLKAMKDNVPITTVPPPPAAFFWAYQEAAARGAQAIVSMHLSNRLSTTCDAAAQAATQIRIPVHIVDSQSSGMSLGFTALAAAQTAGRGGDAGMIRDAAQRRAKTTRVLIYVDTLEYLHRSGRIGSAAAFMGNALSIKPLLTVNGGEVEPLGKVRGSSRAIGKMVDNAVKIADDQQVDIAVEHFDAQPSGLALLNQLRKQIPRGREFVLTQVSAAIGAHVGPGALAVTISPV